MQLKDPPAPAQASCAPALLSALLLLATACLPYLQRGMYAAPASAHLRPRASALRTAAQALALGSAQRSPFTTYSCTAGSQAFTTPWHVFTHNYKEPSWLGYRMCLVRNVCLVRGVPQFYVDQDLEARLPPPLRLASLGAAGFLYRGPYEATVGEALAPAIVPGPRPPHLPFAPPGRLYLATSLNNAQNYAHVLLDTVLPAYSAADFYGLDIEDVQHVGLTTCDTFQNHAWVSKGSGASFASACWQNFERWYAPLMPHAFLDASAATAATAAEGMCYDALLLGQDAVFSGAMFGGQMSRARAVRALRARARAAAGLSDVSLPPASAATLLALQQHQPVNAATAFPDLCALVRGGLPADAGAARVACSLPGNETVGQQLRAAGDAAVIVCEHGSTCYAALFASPGASVVVLVPRSAPAAKEGHVLLFLPDIAVYFVGEDSARERGGAELAATLELAWRNAQERMGVGEVA